MARKTQKGAQDAPVTKKSKGGRVAAQEGSVAPEAAEGATGAEAAGTAAAPDPAPSQKGGKRAKAPKVDATLADVFEGYVDALDKAGKSDGTISSYRMELALAGAELGLETKVADLTPEQVLLYFGSPRVVEKRNGKPKSPLSIDKTRRVLRQALQHAETAGLVAKAPLPEQAATH